MKDGNTIIHCSAVAQWEIDDMASYTANKANYEEIMDILNRGYPGIVARLGQAGLPLPVRVVIEKGGCCGGWAGGGDVGYNDGDFEDAGGMDWIRGVVIGEVVNAVTGTVTDNWPSDWWVDGVWYFPGFVVVDVLKDVTDAKTATGWEVREKYPTYPIYKLFVELKTEKGWEFFQDFFAKVKADKMQWSQIGANPSAIKTNYVIAYMSLAYGENLGARFTTAKAAGASVATIQAIMDAHAKLEAAAQAGTKVTTNWAAFRKGDYAGAANGL